VEIIRLRWEGIIGVVFFPHLIWGFVNLMKLKINVKFKYLNEILLFFKINNFTILMYENKIINSLKVHNQ
jgi:hypothetical protein